MASSKKIGRDAKPVNLSQFAKLSVALVQQWLKQSKPLRGRNRE